MEISELSNVVFTLILPVMKPLARGLNGTNPIPSSSVSNNYRVKLKAKLNKNQVHQLGTMLGRLELPDVVFTSILPDTYT